MAGLLFQNPRSISSIASQFLTVSPVPMDPKLSSGLCRHQTHKWYTDIDAGKTSIHIKKINKREESYMSG